MNTPVSTINADVQDLLRLAVEHQKAGRHLEASHAYINVVRRNPDHWPAYYNLAISFQALDRLDDARIAYERVVAINPKSAQAHNNLGSVLKTQKRMDDAERAYANAVAVDPNLSEARYNLALIEQSKGHHSDSAASLQKVVELNPLHDDAWDALYRILFALKRPEEAIATFLKWELAIGSSPALTAAGLALSRTLAVRDREAKYVKLAIEWPFEQMPLSALAPILGMIQYFDVSPEALLACYRRHDAAVSAQIQQRVTILPARSAGEKLRVGYVSADFRKHVMGHLMMDVFESHDRSKFELTLISLCEQMFHDDVTEKFKNIAGRFIDVSTLSDFDAAKAIAEADLDVLVDLAGQSMGARPAIYAYRPARHLATHLGYHGCLGLSAVDYKFTDAIADLPQMAQYQIERPYYLEGCLFPFRHVPSSEQDEQKYVSLRAQLKLEGKTVFCAFVNILKLSPRCLDAWKLILDQVPNAIIAFSPMSVSEEPGFRRVMASAGIDESRIRFIPAGKTDGEQRARYRLVDVVLDTFPYAGGDTTLAALDRDVPVVTLAGQRNSGRVGVSILTSAGVADTVCQTVEEYVQCAVRLARDSEWRNSLRAKLFVARQHSPFYQTATHTRALERAYVEICGNSSLKASNLSAQEFFARFQAALRTHQTARADDELRAISTEYEVLSNAQPEYVPLLQLRASIAQSLNQNAEASRLLQSAHALSPLDAQISVSLARMLFESKSYGEALLVLESITVTPRDKPDFWLLKARTLSRLGRMADALPYALEARKIAPANPETNFVYATLLASLDRDDEALTAFGQVLSLAPKHAEAMLNAALLLMGKGAANQAEDLLRRALQVEPPHELAYATLAGILKSQGKIDAWTKLAQVFLVAFPKSLRAKTVFAESQRFVSNIASEVQLLNQVADQLIVEEDHNLVAELAVGILHRAAAIELPITKEEKLRQRFEAALIALHDIAPPSAFIDAVSTDELRLGFLMDSLDSSVRSDAAITLVNRFAEKLGNAFLYVLSPTSAETATQVTARIDGGVEVRYLAGRGAHTAATVIRDDHLNIVADLCGFRHPLAPQILVQRVAALQVANGAFGDMAESSWFDVRLFDQGTKLPIWEARGPTEPMLQCSALVPGLLSLPSPAGATRARDGATGFVFGISTAVQDLSAEALGLWKAILDGMPNSVLAIPAQTDQELRCVHRLFQSAGIGSHRIITLDAAPANAGRLSNVALMLDNKSASDPFVALESLLAGVPIVTARGSAARERLVYSVLLQADLGELVAESGPDYVELALRVARDDAVYKRIREKLRAWDRVGSFDVDRDIAYMRAALNHIRTQHTHAA
jgi:protein O-GlcNAc transferase